MNRPLGEAGAILAGLFTLSVMVIGAAASYFLLAQIGVILYAAVFGLIIVVAVHAAWHLTRKRLGLPVISPRLALAALIGYAITLGVGAPRVHTDLASSEIAQYKKLKAQGGGRVGDTHPRIEFFVSVPIAPAILLTYHEYQLAGLWGEGRWDLHAWYLVGSHRIIGLGTWIS